MGTGRTNGFILVKVQAETEYRRYPRERRSRVGRAMWVADFSLTEVIHTWLPSIRSRLNAALINARCVKACGKLPSASPCGPVCSA